MGVLLSLLSAVVVWQVWLSPFLVVLLQCFFYALCSIYRCSVLELKSR